MCQDYLAEGEETASQKRTRLAREAEERDRRRKAGEEELMKQVLLWLFGKLKSIHHYFRKWQRLGNLSFPSLRLQRLLGLLQKHIACNGGINASGKEDYEIKLCYHIQLSMLLNDFLSYLTCN